MPYPRIRMHTLSSSRDAQGVHCDAEGLFVGCVPLLEERPGFGLRKRWAVRPLAWINRDLEACYGLPIDVAAKMSGIEAVATALDERDVARACIVAVHLRIPPIPERTPLALAKCAAALAESGILDVGAAARLTKFNPHHDQAGRFASADGARSNATAPDKRNREAKPKGVQEAGVLGELFGHRIPPPMGGYRPRRYRQNENQSLTDPPPPIFPSGRPDASKEKRPPAAVETQQTPAASAGTPEPNPNDRKPDDDKKPKGEIEKPTVRLTEEYKNIVLDEHPGLTREGLAKIEEETQPPRNTARQTRRQGFGRAGCHLQGRGVGGDCGDGSSEGREQREGGPESD